MASPLRLNHQHNATTYDLYNNSKKASGVNVAILNYTRISAENGTPPAKATGSERLNVAAIDLKPGIRKGAGEIHSFSDIVSFNKQVLYIAAQVMKDSPSAFNALKNKVGISDDSAMKNDRAATHRDIIMARNLENTVISHIAKDIKKQNNISFSEARLAASDVYKETRMKYLNDRSWDNIEKSFVHNNVEYVSKHSPAAQMKNGENDIFPVSYAGKGACAWDTKNVQHATNLWVSNLSVKKTDGKVEALFSGIRHGVLSPFGIRNEQQRHAGAVTRAKEVVSAALFSKPDLLERALKGENVPLRLVSTSLLTPTKTMGKEDVMLQDQMKAWTALNKSGKPLTLEIRNANGDLQKVNLMLEVAPFNFGVNELSLIFKMGNDTSDKYNLPALHQLLGADLKPGSELKGWVGEYLSSNPGNARIVKELSEQIKGIWHDHSHRRIKNEPYKMVQRISMLANEINSVPCWNCKSGKDRTGMLYDEIIRETISLHQKNELSKPGAPLKSIDKSLFLKVLMNSGNLEVQEKNSGLAGNKVIKDILGGMSFFNLGYKERIGSDEVWKKAKALSGLVVS